jgi:ADP-heptose:LPS heptosyltransferase
LNQENKYTQIYEIKGVINMSLNQNLRELNWRRNFALKRLKLRIKFLFFSLIRLFLPYKTTEFDLSKAKKILIIRNDRIGDMVVTTSLIRNLAKSGYSIYVVSTKSALDIVKFNPYVKGTIIYDNSTFFNWIKSIVRIRKECFDAAIEVKFIRCFDMKHMIFCSYIKTPILIGFNKSNIKSFNLSIPNYLHKSHVTVQLKQILETFNIKYDDMHYEIPVSENIKTNATLFLKKIADNNKKVAVLNPFGSIEARSLSHRQVNIIYKLLSLKYKIIVIGEKKRIKQLTIPEGVAVFSSPNILDVVPLIELSDLVISVDTSIVHIATCFNKNTIALYADSDPNQPGADKKAIYHHEFSIFKFALEDFFYNKEYLKTHSRNIMLPITHDIWAPNNKNAKRILFDQGNIANVADELFESKLVEALKNID